MVVKSEVWGNMTKTMSYRDDLISGNDQKRDKDFLKELNI
jgi:hypothetical protein